MAEDNSGLDREEEELLQQADTEEDEGVSESGVENLYRFIYSEPDAVLGLILEILDILEEKGILNEDEIDNILKEGFARWTERK